MVIFFAVADDDGQNRRQQKRIGSRSHLQMQIGQRSRFRPARINDDHFALRVFVDFAQKRAGITNAVRLPGIGSDENDDFGVFDSPDEFYARHGSNLSGLKRWLYAHVIRHRMNAQVRRIRAEKW